MDTLAWRLVRASSARVQRAAVEEAERMARIECKRNGSSLPPVDLPSSEEDPFVLEPHPLLVGCNTPPPSFRPMQSPRVAPSPRSASVDAGAARVARDEPLRRSSSPWLSPVNMASPRPPLVPTAAPCEFVGPHYGSPPVSPFCPPLADSSDEESDAEGEPHAGDGTPAPLPAEVTTPRGGPAWPLSPRQRGQRTPRGAGGRERSMSPRRALWLRSPRRALWESTEKMPPSPVPRRLPGRETAWEAPPTVEKAPPAIGRASPPSPLPMVKRGCCCERAGAERRLSEREAELLASEDTLRHRVEDLEASLRRAEAERDAARGEARDIARVAKAHEGRLLQLHERLEIAHDLNEELARQVEDLARQCRGQAQAR